MQTIKHRIDPGFSARGRIERTIRPYDYKIHPADTHKIDIAANQAAAASTRMF